MKRCRCPLLRDLLQTTTKRKLEFCWPFNILPPDKHQDAHACISKHSFGNDRWGFSVLGTLISERLRDKLLPVGLAAELYCHVFHFPLRGLEHPKAGQKGDGKNHAENGKLDPTSAAASRQSIWTSFTTAPAVVPFASFKPLFIHGGWGSRGGTKVSGKGIGTPVYTPMSKCQDFKQAC